MSKIDWNLAKKDYVSDPRVTIQDISEKYGVSRKVVGEHSVKEGWTAARQSVVKKADEKTIANLSEDLAKVNERHTLNFKNVQSIALALLQDYADEITEARKLGKRAIMVDVRQLKALQDTLRSSVEGERITLGLATSVTKNEHTGANGTPLFKEYDADKLDDAISTAIASLTSR